MKFFILPFVFGIDKLLQIVKFLTVILPFRYEQIYIHDISHSKAELKLPSTSDSPIIDPHLSPDGSMLAYVRDCELHVLNLLSNESKQLTHGAEGNGLVSTVVGWSYCTRVT